MLSKKCEYIEKEEKVISFITDDLEYFLMSLTKKRLKPDILSDLFLKRVSKINRKKVFIHKSFSSFLINVTYKS